MTLFPEDFYQLPLNDGDFIYYPKFFTITDSDYYFHYLLENINWKHQEIKLFGKNILQPRLTALYGDIDKTYTYSNLTLLPNPWNPLLIHLKEKLESRFNLKFNSVLLNLYRDENDSNGWHADNEKELGMDPQIISISFGEKRLFQLKHNTNPNEKFSFELEHGSVLIMKKGSQLNYKHQIPKSKQPKKQRINLTFRWIE